LQRESLKLARVAPGVEAEQRDDANRDVEEQVDGDGVNPHRHHISEMSSRPALQRRTSRM
jgi:hypothetical protein